MIKMPIETADFMPIITVNAIMDAIKQVESQVTSYTCEFNMPTDDIVPMGSEIAILTCEDENELKESVSILNEVLQENFDFCLMLPIKFDPEDLSTLEMELIDEESSLTLTEVPWECDDPDFWDSVK